jgi:hypothetical protein
VVSLPGGSAGVGFDDLRFSVGLRQLLVPAGRTGALALVDPRSLEVSSIAGFSQDAAFRGGHDFGATSADEGDGWVFVIDRTSGTLSIASPDTGVVAHAPLGASADYVRYVGERNEVWVSEPDSEQVEIFALSTGRVPTLKHVAFISVPGGPESLVIDNTRGRAYGNVDDVSTVSIDLATRTLGPRWPNGCKKAKGLTLDEARGFLLVACGEGKAVNLDADDDGRQLSSLASGVGSGIDVIDYDARRRRLYLPGATSATLAIVDVSRSGGLSLVASVRTAAHAHCVVSDGAGHAFVCDPDHGQLLVVRDYARR